MSLVEKALKKLSTQIKCSHKPFTVHTFGFGPGVDSRLLSNIANAGWGSYTYIPSAALIVRPPFPSRVLD